jgi:hypothetical protein
MLLIVMYENQNGVCIFVIIFEINSKVSEGIKTPKVSGSAF